VDRLASILDQRAATNHVAAAAGLVVNTLGWTDGLGYELQLHAIQALKVGRMAEMGGFGAGQRLFTGTLESNVQVSKNKLKWVAAICWQRSCRICEWAGWCRVCAGVFRALG
jgi:hypothetical protein